MAAGPRFSFADWQLTTTIVDVDATRMQQSRLGSFEPRLEANSATIGVSFDYPHVSPAPLVVKRRLGNGPLRKGRRVRPGRALALFDYMRKSRSNGVVISASGGADSSAVACLAALMVNLGVRELGLARYVEKLDTSRDCMPRDRRRS